METDLQLMFLVVHYLIQRTYRVSLSEKAPLKEHRITTTRYWDRSATNGPDPSPTLWI